VTLLGLVIFGIASVRPQLMGRYLKSQTYEDVYYLPAAAWLPLMSLGYREALADGLWMKGLVYFGEEIRHRGNARNIYNYAESMLALDPYFRAVYRWVGMGAIYRTGKISIEDVKRAVSFLKRGANRFPNDGELAWDLAATLRYELMPYISDRREKEAMKEYAMEYMLAAARLGGGPPWLVLTNITELRRLGQAEQAVRHLEEMYASVQDPSTKQQIGFQLEHMRGLAFKEAVEHANEVLTQQRSEHFPYMNDNLYLCVGRRKVARSLHNPSSDKVYARH